MTLTYKDPTRGTGSLPSMRGWFDEQGYYIGLRKVDLLELFTFDRASDKTAFNKRGELVTYPSGELAFEYDPVTGESLGASVHVQRTNELPFSYEFDQSYWGKDGIVLSPTVSEVTGLPSSILTADGTGLKRLWTSPFPAADEYRRFIAIFRPLSETPVRVGRLTSTLAAGGITVNPDGTFTSVSSNAVTQIRSQLLPNGAIYITGVINRQIIVSGWQFGVSLLNESGQQTTEDNGESCELIYLSLTPSSSSENIAESPPIITSGTALTRLEDQLSIMNLGEKDWFNTQQGTFVVRARVAGNPLDSASILFEITNETGGGSRILARFENSGALALFAGGGPSQGIIAGSQEAIEDGKEFVIAFSYDGLRADICINGNSVITNNNRSEPFGADAIISFLRGVTTARSVGAGAVIKSAIYEPRAYTPEQLQAASQLGSS